MIGKVIVAGLLMFASAPPGGGTGNTTVESSQKDRTVAVTLKDSQIVITGTGLSGRSDGYRVKRPCWYEPGKNAADMLKEQQDSKPTWIPETEWRRHLDSLKQFEEKVGKEGRWWTRGYNAADPDALSCLAGLEPYVFVPPNTTPPSGITVTELADIARAALTVPEPKIKLNPDARSYVNLPTWVWLDDVGQTTRSVTATLPGVMSATVTATFDSVKIKSGTTSTRAEVREKCGPGGKPYTKGAEFDCGVRYLRASADQPRDVYTMTVTSVWTVTANVAGVQYDPIQADATRDVPVGEVQSTVRTGTR
ncbi:hypothetical protein GCM10017600_19270 [Streptosporangium carneum]|uniref:Enoyl reductase n=1 Tax=Streptosporangium carneum TaxID=47481 RepID=A0A9W6HY79_9ACTN|nr:hypothetical protein GCM10017600_19270 [Streptosporangium carneum]